ncbi:MAG: penicillin-binding protein 2 [Legionellales bacterium]|nr:penicillin-binding protein 2 [Legionellales bacterium]
MRFFFRDQVEVILKDRDKESSIIKKRIFIVGSIIALLIGGLIFGLFSLAVVQHEHYTTLSKTNRQKILPIAPIRGLIYSNDGVVLAENKPTYSLQVIPEKIDDIDNLITRLREIVHIDDEDIKKFQYLSSKKRRFERVALKENLTEKEVALFSVNRHLFSSVDVVESFYRNYPLGKDLAHSIGYVSRIDENDLENISEAGLSSNYIATTHIGKLGIEKSYESFLHGKVGYQKVEVNAEGRVIRILEKTSPISGNNIYLSIDLLLQKTAAESLGDRKGAIVAMDPRSGNILAFVSSPTYDPNQFSSGINAALYKSLLSSKNKPLVNRVIQGKYPPGSTIKPFLGLIALDNEIRNLSDEVWCPGWFSLDGHDHRYRDWKKEGHGRTNLDKAIIESCDVFFYKLAFRLGIDEIYRGLSDFGFGQVSGIDITAEKNGLLPSRRWKKENIKDPWFPGETVILGIGQGYALATPMQLVVATAAIANKGILFEPKLVSGISNQEGIGITTTSNKIKNRIQLKNNSSWKEILKSMQSVVHDTNGTAWKSGLNAEYNFAGKTGTAQIIGIDQESEYKEEEIPDDLKDHALFIALAPVEQPEIALAIVVENGGGGSKTAAPIARKMLDSYFFRKDSNSDE